MQEVPDPRNYVDLKAWADAVFEFLRSKEELTPSAILLSRKQALDKATENGIVQFDTATGRVVVSVSGVWKALAFVP